MLHLTNSIECLKPIDGCSALFFKITVVTPVFNVQSHTVNYVRLTSDRNLNSMRLPLKKSLNLLSSGKSTSTLTEGHA